MGWWTTNKEGASFAQVRERTEAVLIWGDGPADIMGDAIQLIEAEFEKEWARKPTIDELVAGVRFSARPLYDEAADMAAHDAGAETQFEREEGASD